MSFWLYFSQFCDFLLLVLLLAKVIFVSPYFSMILARVFWGDVSLVAPFGCIMFSI